MTPVGSLIKYIKIERSSSFVVSRFHIAHTNSTKVSFPLLVSSKMLNNAASKLPKSIPKYVYNSTGRTNPNRKKHWTLIIIRSYSYRLYLFCEYPFHKKLCRTCQYLFPHQCQKFQAMEVYLNLALVSQSWVNICVLRNGNPFQYLLRADNAEYSDYRRVAVSELSMRRRSTMRTQYGWMRDISNDIIIELVHSCSRLQVFYTLQQIETLHYK